jgi:hypothetical protein
LNKYIDEVESQNKFYFEGKAKDLLEMRKQDPLSLIMANLLFKSLNISMEQYIQKLSKSGSVSINILAHSKTHSSQAHPAANSNEDQIGNKENSSLAFNNQNSKGKHKMGIM